MPFLSFNHQRSFADLSDREVLALAIQNEEEDGRIYRDFADRLRADFPASAAIFSEMAEEENTHRQMLFDIYRQRFGEHIPLIRRDDVRGFIRRKPVWMTGSFDIDAMRQRAESMEEEAANFYRRAAARTSDAAMRKLLDDLADIEAGHEAHARQLTQGIPETARQEERETARRNFVLQVIQPGLAGLMDGSVSTLA
ncbi:MAG TPA: ferritin family protein, partial [Bauldia sp.]|nr:ferritin family protein [Bauldia sp.]